jgi:hypothetical protein
MSKPKLALIPSGYKSGKVYSILPNDATGDFDFDRASEGTRVRKDGLIEEVTNDVPRLDWLNSNCPSLLLEPQSLNSQNYSEDLTNGFSNGSTSVLSNVIISPDGTLNADKLVESNTNARHELYGATISFSGTTSVSFFAKASERRYISVFIGGDPTTGGATFDVEDGVVSLTSGGTDASIVNYGNGWYRCSLTSTKVASSFIYYCLRTNASAVDVQTYQGDGTSGMYLWGFQTEVAQSYPTSYIKTEASALTRLKDECYGGGTADLFNDNEGVLFLNMKSFVNGGTNRFIQIHDGTYNNAITLYFTSTTNRIVARVWASGSSVLTLNYTVDDVTQYHKYAFKYKLGDYQLWVDGTKVLTNSLTTTPTGLNQIGFLQGTAGNDFFGKVKDLRYFDNGLTDAELTDLTTL